MAGKLSLLFYSRIKLRLRSPFLLPRKSYLPLTSIPAAVGARNYVPLWGIHPRRYYFSGAEEQFQMEGRMRMPCDETLGSSPYRGSPVPPLPEWLSFVDYLTACGYTGQRIGHAIGEDEEFSLDSEKTPEDFRNLAVACLRYAREWPDLLRYLPKKEIGVLVENGSPFLFRNSSDSVSRMKSFIYNQVYDVSAYEQACTVDLMRYLLSSTWKFLNSSGGSNNAPEELLKSSVKTLLHELVNISSGTRGSNSTTPRRHDYSGYHESQQRPQQTIEMKKGDWLCPKCNFMNFARNIKCLECNEARPKKQLTGGDWECPQCDFLNYARNRKCLRCDCKPSKIPGLEQTIHPGNVEKAEMERRLAENDEKAERWFSKISQLGSSDDLRSAVDDEDFPEIMPLRKGMNRFVVSTRKTPLERRLANSTSKGGLPESTVRQTLDRILSSSAGRESNLTSVEKRFPDMARQQEPYKPSYDTSKESSHDEENHSVVPPPYKRRIAVDQANNSNFIPFVPLPPDYFAKKENVGHASQSQPPSMGQRESQQTVNETSNHGFAGKSLEGSAVTEPDPLRMSEEAKAQRSFGHDYFAKKENVGHASQSQPPSMGQRGSQQTVNETSLEGSAVTEPDPLDMSEEAKAQRWFRRVSQIKDISELSNIPDEDFPEIMPLRKGVNRFVVSKRKTPLERRLTSPQYRRNLPIMSSSDNDKDSAKD